MFIGFDYGTSNCAVAIMDKGKPTLLPLEGDSAYIPSTLCAPTRESVSEHLFRHLNILPSDEVGEQILRRSIAYNREEGIELLPEDIVFGQAALELYLKRSSRCLLCQVTKILSWCFRPSRSATQFL